MATDKVVKSDKDSGDKVVQLSDIVNFKASKPKDFKGVFYMKDGKTYQLHRLHAERLEAKGLGKITA